MILLTGGVLLITPWSTVDAENITVNQALQLVQEAKNAFATHSCYTTIFNKAERVDPDDDDDDIIYELLDFRWQKSPERTYIRFLATNTSLHEDVAMIYPDSSGECDSDEIITNSFPECLGPGDWAATVNSRHPVTEAPMNDLFDLVIEELTRAKNNPSHNVSITMTGPAQVTIGGGTLEGVNIPSQTLNVQKFTAEFPTNQVTDPDNTWVSKRGNNYYAKKVEMWLNTTNKAFAYIKTWDRTGQWVEEYEFINLTFDSCPADSFDPTSPQREAEGFDAD